MIKPKDVITSYADICLCKNSVIRLQFPFHKNIFEYEKDACTMAENKIAIPYMLQVPQNLNIQDIQLDHSEWLLI